MKESLGVSRGMRMEEDGVPQSEVKGIPELVPVRVQESPQKPHKHHLSQTEIIY